MTESTVRYALPLIAPGQAQKEMSHNEALAALDLLVGAQVEAVGLDVPPVAPQPGQCWVVGTAPSGAWAGQARALAGWTGGGWRFVAAREGMSAWTGGTGGFVRHSGGAWQAGELRGQRVLLGGQQVIAARQPAVTDPTGGPTVDAEARAAIAAILGALRAHGLIDG